MTFCRFKYHVIHDIIVSDERGGGPPAARLPAPASLSAITFAVTEMTPSRTRPQLLMSWLTVSACTRKQTSIWLSFVSMHQAVLTDALR